MNEFKPLGSTKPEDPILEDLKSAAVHEATRLNDGCGSIDALNVLLNAYWFYKEAYAK